MTGQINVNKIAARTGTTINVESGHTFHQAGTVLQTVSTTIDGQTTTSSTSTYASTPTTATITPKFATSKILVFSNAHRL